MTFSAGLAATALMSSCSTPPRTTPSSSELFRPTLLSAPIVLMADNQEHEITGLPNSLSGRPAEFFNEVAIRQPFHSLFGRKLLEYVLLESIDGPVLHLGDLLDLSCDSEYERMRQILLASERLTVIAPGNHDGLLNGIFDFNLRREQFAVGALTWRLRCQSADLLNRPERHYPQTRRDADWHSLMARDEYLRCYLALLQAKNRRNAVTYGDSDCKDAAKATTIDFRTEPSSAPSITALRGRIEPSVFAPGNGDKPPTRRFTASWLLQKLHVPAPRYGASVGVVIIDTTNIDNTDLAFDTARAAMGRESPGDVGYVGAAQRLAIKALVDEAREDILVFAGHHHWDSINSYDRDQLSEAMARGGRSLIYLSAHTHTGFWKAHTTAQGYPLLELNVSSLADWPIAFRTVRFELEQPSGRVRVVSPLGPLAKETVAPRLRPAAGGEMPSVSGLDHIGLLSAWTATACSESGAMNNSMFDKVDAVVSEHRGSSSGLIDAFVVALHGLLSVISSGWYQKSDSDDWTARVYASNLNDLEHTLRAVQVSAELNRAWAAALVTNSSELQAECGAESLRQCLGSRIDRARLLRTRDRFDALFRLKGMITPAITRLGDRQHVAYMACLAVLGAFSDWQRASRQPSLEATLIDRERVATPPQLQPSADP